jgi:zinc and cadmium transporter
MTLVAILLATLAAGIGSVWVADLLLRAGLGRGNAQQGMLSLAAGALLATAFMHLLPEAFESEAGAKDLFLTLLVGVVFFFLLTKAELWHHGHEHHHAPLAQGRTMPITTTRTTAMPTRRPMVTRAATAVAEAGRC